LLLETNKVNLKSFSVFVDLLKRHCKKEIAEIQADSLLRKKVKRSFDETNEIIEEKDNVVIKENDQTLTLRRPHQVFFSIGL
jgi:CRISPR/Cas system-associated exonuclease Cas4 (RecB family)